MFVFDERGKPKHLEEKFLEQIREPGKKLNRRMPHELDGSSRPTHWESASIVSYQPLDHRVHG